MVEKRARGRPKGSRNKAQPVLSPKMHEELAELAGNGQDEAVDEPEVQEALQAADELVRPQPAPGPHIVQLSIVAVENGYLIEPALSDKAWIATSTADLARMVAWLVAERGVASPQPQPGPHYAPPQEYSEA